MIPEWKLNPTMPSTTSAGATYSGTPAGTAGANRSALRSATSTDSTAKSLPSSRRTTSSPSAMNFRP